MAYILLLGIGAGLVSAVLFASAASGTALGIFVLFFLSPLPIAIAGLGWGWLTSLVAACVAAFALTFVGTGRASLMHGLTIGLPVVALSYQLLLSRTVGPPPPGQTTPVLEWYPVSRVLILISVIAGVMACLAILSIATDLDDLRAELRRVIEQLFAQRLPAPAAQDQDPARALDAFTDLMVAMFPGAVASVWMAATVLNLWLAGHVTRASGRLPRPWPDLAEVSVPRWFPILFAGAVGLTLLPGIAGSFAAGFASAFLMVYVLIGLAILHHVTRGLAVRPLLLGLVYVSLVVLNPFSGMLLALIGLAEPFSPLNRRSSRGPPSRPPPQRDD